MAKRKAPSSSVNTKKPKSTGTSKKDGEVAGSAIETVTSTIQSVASALKDAVDVAGDLVLDEPEKTPVPVAQVVKENVDVEEVKAQAGKAGKTVKGKAAQAGKAITSKAEEIEDQAEKALEGKGVDVKSVKKKAGKAVENTKETVGDVIQVAKPTLESVKENAKPIKGKASKAAKQVSEQVQETAEELADPNSKKRKVAADFMETAEETVKAVAGKVGQVLQTVVEGFGEASGLVADAAKEAQEGKEGPATKKVKGKAQQVAKDAKEATQEKGGKVVADAKTKGEKAVKQVEETLGDVPAAKTRGRQAAAEAQKVAEETIETGKKRGKNAVADAENAVKEAKTTGKRKAKEAAAAVEPTTKKAKSKAEDVAASEPVAKGKKAVKGTAEATAATGKKAAKAVNAAASAAVEAVEEDEDEEDEDMMDGFESTDGEGADSSDDESDLEDAAVKEAGRKIDMSTLPSVAKDDKSVAARLKKAQKKKDTQRGTLYLGRIPHGFYEDQMKEYFSQFGDVTRLRLARNKKTGASKHYAYIEMSSQSVAQIVAETMNNYLLKGHLLKCQVIPQEDVHQELWQGANKKFRKVPRARVEKLRNERARTNDEQEKANKKILSKQDKRKANIKSKGIDYEFEGHA